MSAITKVIVVLNLFWAVYATEKCTSVLFGQQTINQHPLTRAYFPPGTKLQDIQINSGCESVGVSVTACDDVSPSVYVKSVNEALVDRLGLLTFGYVDVVAFCPTTLGPLVVSPRPQVDAFLGYDETNTN